MLKILYVFLFKLLWCLFQSSKPTIAIDQNFITSPGSMIHIKVAFLLTCIVVKQLSTYELPRSAQTRGEYPPGWQEAPDSFEEFPRGEINNKTKTIIDPWVYLQRIGIFKLMLIHTQRYFNSWGYNNTGNLLWVCRSSSGGRCRRVVSTARLYARTVFQRVAGGPI